VKTIDDFTPDDPRDEWARPSAVRPAVGWQRPFERPAVDVPEPMPWGPALAVAGMACCCIAFWIAVLTPVARWIGSVLP
jgi:hypothetical protein